METDSATVQQEGSSDNSNPAEVQSIQPVQPAQTTQPSPVQSGEPVVEEKKTGFWMKLILIILGILIVLGGAAYWIFIR